MPETREQIIERMAGAIRGAQCVPCVGPIQRLIARAALPVAVKAVTDMIRAGAVRSMTPRQIAALCDRVERELMGGGQ